MDGFRDVNDECFSCFKRETKNEFCVFVVWFVDMSEIILVRMCATYLLLFRLQKKSRNQNFLFKTWM